MVEPDLPDRERQQPFHVLQIEDCLRQLQTDGNGLARDEVEKRLGRYGPNILPRGKLPGPLIIFLRQFVNPLIYILMIAAGISLVLREWIDAGFIIFVLLLNAIIGAFQEYHAQRSAEALERLVPLDAHVIRDGVAIELPSEQLVPGDVVLVESGDKVPADMRLLEDDDLEADESLLTGESMPDKKYSGEVLAADVPVADRTNMMFAGTLVLRGRGRGVVVATGQDTQLGRIALDVQQGEGAAPPLIQRMQRFTRWIGISYVIMVGLLGLVAWAQGEEILGILMIAIALAVAAIPEGLPVAVTVALAVGMSKMAKNNVIVRRLVAAETLGSCTLIAADKTGTLTVNELTVSLLQFPLEQAWRVTGEGVVPEGIVHVPDDALAGSEPLLDRLARIGVLCNEGNLTFNKKEWVPRGDPVDVALLAMGRKIGVHQEQLLELHPRTARIPFESERMYAVTANRLDSRFQYSIKGAVERVLPMCNHMAGRNGDNEIDRAMIMQQAHTLAEKGYRVLALADGLRDAGDTIQESDLQNLCFVGLVGMIDPARPEARQSIAECHEAGVTVVMITGDHPVTARSIAVELGLAGPEERVVTGQDIYKAKQESDQALQDLVLGSHVFARIEPHQKLMLVNLFSDAGHFVAVTGDGANDAPALRAAHVGVAMGKGGTDVARESSELIITDDDFSSIVAGIRQGRIAFANVRKVIFLLISTGAVEIMTFILALAAGLPLPLTAVQLLWLNVVSEGIQHVALAFEPGEGNEMKKPPRPPNQPIFDRLMIERVVISALTMGTLAFIVFWYQYSVLGMSIETSRNVALLFLVMFENIQVLNSRSETLSLFEQPFFRNPLLLVGTVAAQTIHILALYTPGLSDLLDAEPVTLELWSLLMLTAFSMLLMMEVHKRWWRHRYGSSI